MSLFPQPVRTGQTLPLPAVDTNVFLERVILTLPNERALVESISEKESHLVTQVQDFIEGRRSRLVPFPYETISGIPVPRDEMALVTGMTNRYERAIVHALCRAHGVYSRRWKNAKYEHPECLCCNATVSRRDTIRCHACRHHEWPVGYREPVVRFDSVVLAPSPIPLTKKNIKELLAKYTVRSSCET